MAHAGPESHKVCRDCQGRGTHEVPDEPIKHMDLGEFRDLGFLQEANRQFFHPLGLALEWNDGINAKGIAEAIKRIVETQPESSAAYMHKAGHLTDARAMVIEVITELGLDKPRLSGVWDYRDDPEGMEFGWEHMPHDEVIQKWINVSEEFVRHVPARRARFGEDGMEKTSVVVTSIQSLPKKPPAPELHSSTCGLGPNHEGGCRP
jgi:hypothetical protein